MAKFDFKELQNGSDIRGVAMEGVDGQSVNLDTDTAKRLGRAFVYWLSQYTKKSADRLVITIGRDSRLSGPNLVKAFSESAASCGCKILDCAMASTPAMFMSTVFDEFHADGGVMVTASHLPFNRNGFKFFSPDGGLDKGDITDIIVFAESDYIQGLLPSVSDSKITDVDLMETYAAHLRELIVKGVYSDGNALREKPLEGMHIVVDAGNGAGGFYASKVLEPLGADISGSQFLTPNGSFPAHAPNPEDKEAMTSIQKAVYKNHADLGLIFDTDVDRAAAVDEKAKEISRNDIVAMAASLIAEKHPGTTVVTDSITSTQLTQFLEKDLGLHHLRFKRGYRNVIRKSIELNSNGTDSQLAIETSGHAAFKENYFLDDGAYLATKIVICVALLHKKGEKISSVLQNLSHPLESKEIRFPINAKDFQTYGDSVLNAVKDWTETIGSSFGASLETPSYEGVRVSFHGNITGWFLLRKSLHDPIMPLNIESDTPGGCDAISDIVKKILTGWTQLDSSNL